MPHIPITASPHGALGEVVAVEDGLVVWAGPIEAIGEAGDFDALFCHDDDEERLLSITEGCAMPTFAAGDDSARAKAK